MTNKRLLFLSMVALTLSIGVIIGTLVSGGVKATFEQKPATIVIPDPVSLSNAFSQIAAQLEPAVVKISVTIAPQPAVRARQGNNRQQPQLPPGFGDFFGFGLPDENPRQRGGGSATGTGFIVDKSGYIMTNHHVVDHASKIEVILSDGSTHTAKLIGSDEASDLGVIKIDTGRDLATAKFGNSDAVKVGDWVLAIGSPFGFDHTVTSGIISAKGRDNKDFGVDQKFSGLQRFLQTDAAINPGNSGGPLVNMGGEVIGINTAIVSETNSFAGLGFALPSNTAAKVYNQLSQHGKVTRGSIGIGYRSERDEAFLSAYGLKGPEAVIIETVYAESPAAKAGLRPDDVITEIDGTKVSNGNQLQDYIVDKPVGTAVKIGYLREGRSQSVSVTVGDRADVLSDPKTSSNSNDRSSPKGGQPADSKLGIEVQPLRAQLSRQFDLSGGVEITSVEDGSVADDAGLTEGMLVMGVVMGGKSTPIANVGDFHRMESQLKSGTAVVLKVRVPDDNFRQDRSVAMKVK